MDSSVSYQELPPFEELVQLAEKNPMAFAELKSQICEEVILASSKPMQNRLRAQQSHLNLVISRCKNPAHTNVVLMDELQKQISKFRQALTGDQTILTNDAQVLPFTPRDFY